MAPVACRFPGAATKQTLSSCCCSAYILGPDETLNDYSQSFCGTTYLLVQGDSVKPLGWRGSWLSDSMLLTSLQDSIHHIGRALSVSTPLDNGSRESLTLSPNPACDAATIAYNTTISGNLEVYDVLGRKLAAQSIAQGSGSWSLDVRDYRPGLYRVVLHREGSVALQQLLVIRH